MFETRVVKLFVFLSIFEAWVVKVFALLKQNQHVDYSNKPQKYKATPILLLLEPKKH